MKRKVSILHVERMLKTLPKGYKYKLDVTKEEIVVHIRDDLNMWSTILFDKAQHEHLKEIIRHLLDIENMSRDEVD